MSKEIAVFTKENFTARAFELEDGSVTFTADADIDADGANGQNGQRPAYKVGNTGSEHLANGGMKMHNGKVIGDSTWWYNIVIVEGMTPREFPGGIIASKTAYRWPDKKADDPAAYVDSETVPYVCVPPEIRQRAKGVVMGCRVKCYHKKTGLTAWGMVADIGPRNKVGEVSIEMARQLGINPSPRTGGEDNAVIEYTVYAGQHATIDGKDVPMITAKGQYVYPPEDMGTLEKIQ